VQAGDLVFQPRGADINDNNEVVFVDEDDRGEPFRSRVLAR